MSFLRYSFGAPEVTSVSLWGLCCSINSFCIVFCRSLSFLSWPLHCLFFDLQLLITPQVSYFRTTYKLVHVLLNQIDLEMIHLLVLSLTKIVIQVGLIKSCNEMHAIIPPTHLIKFWANKTLVINNHMLKSNIKY